MIDEQQQMAWVRKNAWSRERCEDLRAIALTIDDEFDQEIVMDAADFMLEVRQAFRGGRKNVRGSRHWSSDE